MPGSVQRGMNEAVNKFMSSTQVSRVNGHVTLFL
jgi:hypothetical protein